ncbi:MAG: hypothetical protein ABL871_08570, partial [Terricaulis sp.]
ALGQSAPTQHILTNVSHRVHIGHRASRIGHLQTMLTLAIAGWHSVAKPLKNHRLRFGSFSRKLLISRRRADLSGVANLHAANAAQHSKA